MSEIVIYLNNDQNREEQNLLNLSSMTEGLYDPTYRHPRVMAAVRFAQKSCA